MATIKCGVRSVYYLCLSVAIIFSYANYGMSQNLGFMPGDAFFVFDLNEKIVNSLPDEGGEIIFPYRRPLIEQSNFGGYAGFNVLQINNVSPQMIKNIRRAYRDYRKYTPKIVRIDVDEDGPRNDTEVNPPIVFVYNHDVDWLQQRIALKYNEDWSHLPAKAFEGPGRDFALGLGYSRAEIYQPIIETYHAVVEDWRQARRFKPLKVKVPENIAWGKAYKPIKEPVVVKSSGIQVIVPMNEDLKEYVWQKPGYKFYQITLNGIRVNEWECDEEEAKLLTTEVK